MFWDSNAHNSKQKYQWGSQVQEINELKVMNAVHLGSYHDDEKEATYTSNNAFIFRAEGLNIQMIC